MKVPLWVWDHRLGRYIMPPPGLLTRFRDGKLGVEWITSGEPFYWMDKHKYLFKWETSLCTGGFGLERLTIGRWILRPSKRKKQPWYAKQHIRRYQSE